MLPLVGTAHENGDQLTEGDRINRGPTRRELAHHPAIDRTRQRCTGLGLVSRLVYFGLGGAGLQGRGLVGALLREAKDTLQPPESR